MPLDINGYNETFKAFVDFAQAKRHGIADLAAEDNAAALDIDGIIVTLVASGDAVSISADIGEPPAEGRASFADLLLEANLQADAFFAKEALEEPSFGAGDFVQV